MPVLIDRTTATIGGLDFKVARSTLANGEPGPRQWKATPKAIASKRPQYHELLKGGVRKGDIDKQWVITENDWSGGVAGDNVEEAGTVHYTENVDVTVPGRARPIPPFPAITNTNADGGAAVEGMQFNGAVYSARGLRLYRYRANAETSVKTFTYPITDICVHNNTLVVAQGIDDLIWTMDTAESFTQATDAVYIDHMCKSILGQLCRVIGNLFSLIQATDDPKTLALWTGSTAVADSSEGCTDLNPYRDQVAVSKPSGCWVGDGTSFFNALPEIAAMPDQDNGRPTRVNGNDLYYPYVHGMRHWDGQNSDEVGIETQFTTANVADSIPGTRITALTFEGEYLWAATEPSRFPSALPTGVLTTANAGVAFANGTATVTDNDLTTAVAVVLDQSNNFLYVGYSAAFYGVLLELLAGNTVVQTNPINVQQWNGAAWVSVPNINGLTDRTVLASLIEPNFPGETQATATYKEFGRSGMILSGAALNDQSSTINGITAFWIRIIGVASGTVSATLGEVRVLTQPPRCYIWRGRRRRSSDARDHQLVWETWGYVTTPRVGALLYNNRIQTAWRGGTLLAFGRNQTVSFLQPVDANDYGLNNNTGSTSSSYLTTRKLNGVMPQVPKEWLQHVVKGLSIDGSHTILWYYRLDDSATWVLGATLIASQTVVAYPAQTQGKSVQHRYFWSTFASDTYADINEHEDVFNELADYELEHVILLDLTSSGRDTPTEGPDDEDAPNADAKAQLAALMAMVGTAQTLTDETRLGPKQITFMECEIREKWEEGRAYPDLFAQCRLVEIATL